MRTITLKTLADATAQEVFDYVTAKLLEQGTQSKDGNGDCKYRTVLHDGQVLKCAAGWLIADDEYVENMDTGGSTDWYSLIENQMVPSHHEALIFRLQRAHDSFVPDVWPDAFRLIADAYKLEYGNKEVCKA